MFRTHQGFLLEIVSVLLVVGRSHKSVVSPRFQICGLGIGPPLPVNAYLELTSQSVFKNPVEFVLGGFLSSSDAFIHLRQRIPGVRLEDELDLLFADILVVDPVLGLAVCVAVPDSLAAGADLLADADCAAVVALTAKSLLPGPIELLLRWLIDVFPLKPLKKPSSK